MSAIKQQSRPVFNFRSASSIYQGAALFALRLGYFGPVI
jgi:hypothetical protein